MASADLNIQIGAQSIGVSGWPERDEPQGDLSQIEADIARLPKLPVVVYEHGSPALILMKTLMNQQMAMQLALSDLERKIAAEDEHHADWYCGLPWYRRWWAMVTGS